MTETESESESDTMTETESRERHYDRTAARSADRETVVQEVGDDVR